MLGFANEGQRGGGILSSEYPGEMHAPMYMGNGRFKRGAYVGPGTNLTERIRMGDEPINETDKVAQAHDLRYTFARDHSDIRKADNKMLSKLKGIQSEGTDYMFNIMQGRLGIGAKVFMEDWGIAKPENFTSFGTIDDETPADQDMLRSKLTELEQQGYGMRGRGLRLTR